MIDRRTCLGALGAMGGLSILARARFAFAPALDERRLVLVMLRGGLDGLAAVPPHGDKDYAAVRAHLALRPEGSGRVHDLDGFFGLHPSLVHLKRLYDARELSVFHNIGSPCRGHSHAQGQDALEFGGLRERTWLERALEPRADKGWGNTASRPGITGTTEPGDLASSFQAAGRLLAAADGPRVATLEAEGWDTHVKQGGAQGPLADRLARLDGALAVLQRTMGPWAWRRTAILMVTEFGRTVFPNASGGTDHGAGGAAFLFGGAVQGGQVKAEWVGLRPRMLQDGRDQPARTDLRALFKGVLAEHMDVPRKALEEKIFPDSARAQALRGLIRA